MTPPLLLPEWLPWWAQLALLAVLLLFGLMFLLMPFAVFGVKGRLDLLEARLDEIQGEIRSLSLRLPEPGHDDASGDPGREDPASQRPPIPPAPRERAPPLAPSRTEPRLY